MEITVAAVKELRERTNAGMLDCKKALVEANGNLDDAVRILREKGLAAAAKRADRETSDGRIACYLHHGDRIASMVEVNCETDFVARTDQFGELVHELALQVAATNPRFLSIEDVPEDIVEQEKAIYRTQVEGSKPDHIIEKIVEGKLRKFYEEVCLLEQSFVRDPDRKIKDLIADTVVAVGEKIAVRRFVRYELGGE